MKSLRPYQLKAVRDVAENREERPLLVMPTGAGKTYTASEIVSQETGRVLWLAHRTELIEQAARSLSGFSLDVGIIKAGYPAREFAPVQVASVPSLARRPVPDGVRLVVIDESHHATAKTYGKILERCGGARRLGLTATPFRLDGSGLGDVFGKIVVATTVRELCDQGYLHEPLVYCGQIPDLRGVGTRGGDYQIGKLAERMSSGGIIGDVVGTWRKRGRGRTVCFAVNLEHVDTLVKEFQLAGVRAEGLSGETPENERASILRRLKDGVVDVVVNCMVLTEGWDLPSLETAILARPTASLNLHLQMVGRIMRSCDGKDGAIVLDHAANHIVHGRVTREIEYSLDAKKKAGEQEPLGLRICRGCQFLFDLKDPCCPECGWKPEKRDMRVVMQKGQLTELSDQAEREQFWIALEAQRQASGYKEGWSAYRFKERFGEWPTAFGCRLVDPENASQDDKRGIFKKYLTEARDRGYKPGWASFRFKERFGHWPRGFVNDVRNEVFGAEETTAEDLALKYGGRN